MFLREVSSRLVFLSDLSTYLAICKRLSLGNQELSQKKIPTIIFFSVSSTRNDLLSAI